MSHHSQQNQLLFSETLESELSDAQAQMIVGGESFTATVPQVQALAYVAYEEDLPQKNSAIITDNIIG